MKGRLRQMLPLRSPGNGATGLLEEVRSLTDQNRREPKAGREIKLVQLRNEAFEELERRPPAEAPEMRDEPSAEALSTIEMVDGIIPTIEASQLNAEVARAAILRSGCLHVRGLVPESDAARLVVGIDRAFSGRDEFVAGAKASETAPWFRPFTSPSSHEFSGLEWNRHTEGSGSVWAVDSPRMMFDLIETLGDVGALDVAEQYLGERPAFSVKKAVLRRVTADSGTAWHQDGAFLGEGIRTINIWVALTPCGRDAPGMDLVAKRLDGIVSTGTPGSLFDWAVSDRVVDKMTEAPIVRPIFEAGDALLFDHLCLHRTAATPDMPNLRYATETWCFAPSSYPYQQIPIVV